MSSPLPGPPMTLGNMRSLGPTGIRSRRIAHHVSNARSVRLGQASETQGDPFHAQRPLLSSPFKPY